MQLESTNHSIGSTEFEISSDSGKTKQWNAFHVPFEFQQIEHGGAGPACLRGDELFRSDLL